MSDEATAGTSRSERWAALLSMVADRGRLGVTQASEDLGVSEATIRRDFTELAEQQLVKRTHGGVVATSISYDLPTRYRSDTRSSEPGERVAAATAALLPTEGVVGFNGGTTTTATARHLVRRPELSETARGSQLTVVTNALNIASELVLRPHLRCLCLGGMARPESYELTGPLAHSAMDQLWLTVLVLGVNGVSRDGGATCRHEDEAGINALMARRADQVIVAATGDKIGATSFARICTTERIDVLVTDGDAPPRARAQLADAGIEVVVA